MPFALLLGLLLLVTPGTAHAHADGLPIGPYEVWHHWALDPWLWAPLLLAHWAYGRGVLRAWARAGRGRIIERWRVAAFVSGEATIVLALISPLDGLGETLLSAHMVQHLLLTTAAPLLLVLSAPERAWTWALPHKWRRLGRARIIGCLMQAWSALTQPLTAFVLHSAALWAWHAPALFDAALRDEGVHTLEHLTFFVTALMFWSGVCARRTAPGYAALLVLSLFMQCGLLGAVLSLAPVQLYAYGDRAMLWGLSPLEDQQISGLIMWAPAGLLYLAPFVFFVWRTVSIEDQSRGRLRDNTGIMRASTSSRSMK